ncbi:MAG TPA: hypothetical protein PK861_00280 [Thermomonas sp.]|nr:hypothetical protein [Thermomonas sp.]
MALQHAYLDGYLSTLVNEAREAQAISDVDVFGTLPAAWVTRLVILRAYVITCLECQKAPDDTFAAKLSAYRKEFEQVLVLARQAQTAVDAANTASAPQGASGGYFTVEIHRA